MSRQRDLAFARVVSNVLLGGSMFGAVVALFRMWERERQQQER